MSETDENKRNKLILIALADVFGVKDFDEAFKAASKLKAEVDGGIYVLYNNEHSQVKRERKCQRKEQL